MLRRAFLQKILALTCAAGFVSDEHADVTTLQTINLVFHGPFAFIVDDSIQKVRVLTPNNSDHAYTWYDGHAYTRMKGAYELMGDFNVGGMPQPDSSKSIVISGAQCGNFHAKDAGTGPGFCSFILPYPTTAPMPLRFITGSDVDNVHFYGRYASSIRPKQLPLVHVLSYTVNSSHSVVIKADDTEYSDWRPNINAAYANLHIFAEPPCGVDASHAEVAFSELAALVHPNVADLFCRIYPLIYPPLPAGSGQIGDNETETLEERCYDMGVCPMRSASGGTRIVNCMSVFVTN